MKLAVGTILALSSEAASVGQVSSNAVCRDPDTGVFYQPNEEWVRQRVFHGNRILLKRNLRKSPKETKSSTMVQQKECRGSFHASAKQMAR